MVSSYTIEDSPPLSCLRVTGSEILSELVHCYLLFSGLVQPELVHCHLLTERSDKVHCLILSTVAFSLVDRSGAPLELVHSCLLYW